MVKVAYKEWWKKEARDNAGHDMSEMDKYYQILGLNPGASEEEIKQAYKDLVNVWHPDRFLNNPRLREKANEKLKEINEAYNTLKSYIAGNPRYASSEGHDKSQPPPHESPPKSEKARSSTAENGGYGQSTPPPNKPPPGFSQHSTQPVRSHISWILSLFFVAMGATIGNKFSSELIGAISGLLMGVGVSRFINKMDGTRKYKVKYAWGVAFAGFLVFIIMLGLTAHEPYTHTASVTYSPSLQEKEPISTMPNELEQYREKSQPENDLERYKKARQPVHETEKLSAADSFNKGLSFYKAGRNDDAIQAFNEAIFIDPNHTAAYYYRGEAFEGKRQHDDALGDFTKVISINPDNEWGYIGRGWVFLRKRYFDEALRDFNKALSMYPDSYGAYNGRGWAKHEKGQYDGAIEDFNCAIHIDPNHPAMYYNRGCAYLALRNDQLATTDFEKAIKLKNVNVREFEHISRDCYIGLSLAYFRQGQIKDAKANYQKAIEIEPLCKKGLDAVEKKKDVSYALWEKQTVNEILKLFEVGKN